MRTCPLLQPIASKFPLEIAHPNELIVSSGISNSLVTFELWEFHRYIELESPTAKKLSDDQSTKFR